MLALLVFCTAVVAFADDGGYSAAQYAAAAKSDVATKMLGYVFGDVKGYFDGTNTYIAQMFLVFNSAVAAVAVLMLMVNIMSATIQTAHEGEILGRRYSTIWMPIRNVFGLAGVFPILGGWSIGQAFMFMAALVGIGIGTLTWKTAVTGLIASSSPSSLQFATNIDDDVPMTLLRAQMCALSINDGLTQGGQSLQGVSQGAVRHAVEMTDSGSSDNPWIGFNGTYVVYGAANPGAAVVPDGMAMAACGGIRISAPVPPGDDTGYDGTAMVYGGDPPQDISTPNVDLGVNYQVMVDARYKALLQMDTELQPLAAAFFYKNNPPTKAQIHTIAEHYKATVNAAATAEGKRIGANFYNSLGVEGQSFIWAGAIFNRIAALQRQVAAAADQPLEGVKPMWNPKAGLVDNFKGLMDLGMAKYDSHFQKSTSGFDPDSSEVTSSISKGVFSSKMFRAIGIMTGHKVDLMAGLSNLGSTIVDCAVVALVSTKLLMAGAGVFSLGTLSSLLTFIGEIVLVAVIPLLFAGVVFAFYVPMIPMIVWYGGILSWFIVVIEAVVAAPLWMLAHMEAEGEGMGEKTAHGYMFLLNLFFRPALMVIGLVVGWGILQVFGVILSYALSIFWGSQDQSFSPAGLFMAIACLVVFASLSMYTVNKAFSLIHILPDEVFAFVGGHMRGFGGEEAQESHTNVAAVGRFAQGKAGGGGGDPVANELKEIKELLGGKSASGEPPR